jgi:hypothetical protein
VKIKKKKKIQIFRTHRRAATIFSFFSDPLVKKSYLSLSTDYTYKLLNFYNDSKRSEFSPRHLKIYISAINNKRFFIGDSPCTTIRVFDATVPVRYLLRQMKFLNVLRISVVKTEAVIFVGYILGHDPLECN